ncbi:hypothetical protein BDZ91DRAFT_753537, partial [Kalaharituber pfeilii]
ISVSFSVSIHVTSGTPLLCAASTASLLSSSIISRLPSNSPPFLNALSTLSFTVIISPSSPNLACHQFFLSQV